MQLLVADKVKPVNSHHFVLDGWPNMLVNRFSKGPFDRRAPGGQSRDHCEFPGGLSALQDN